VYPTQKSFEDLVKTWGCPSPVNWRVLNLKKRDGKICTSHRLFGVAKSPHWIHGKIYKLNHAVFTPKFTSFPVVLVSPEMAKKACRHRK